MWANMYKWKILMENLNTEKASKRWKKERKKERYADSRMQTCTFASGLIRLNQCLHIYSYITLCMNIIHLNHPPLNMHHQMCIYMLMQTEYFTEKKDLTSKKKVLIAFQILIEGLCCTVGEHEPFIINLNTATAWGPEPRRVYTDHQSAHNLTRGKSFVWDIVLWGKILQNICACCLCLGAHSHSRSFPSSSLRWIYIICIRRNNLA